MAEESFVEIESNRIGEVKRLLLSQMDDAVQAVTREGERFVKEGIRDTPKTGNVYVKGGVIHIASSEGEFPAIDTATLINSINVQQVRPAVWKLRFGTYYAILLEYGTPTMAPRPLSEPTELHLLAEGIHIARQYLDVV
ncbi:hypothetical protein G4Y79_20880 [Phototrophicus methaneseepsis]|uniref:Phage protein n=1 Tax=Phototrophicus methaneseepsis TaxID=2710758 RepID=A0A7S8E872_9CHLR|nr:hypothetical protein [Phototrophicus methaneseepsis]QPC82112.1 hypothetical protein G4Y79_20880 [Phototrophicus methaneseepsis]